MTVLRQGSVRLSINSTSVVWNFPWLINTPFPPTVMANPVVWQPRKAAVAATMSWSSTAFSGSRDLPPSSQRDGSPTVSQDVQRRNAATPQCRLKSVCSDHLLVAF